MRTVEQNRSESMGSDQARSLARSAFFALAASGRAYDLEVKERAYHALGLDPGPSSSAEMWRVVDSGRVEYTGSGFMPTAGGFPETELEFLVRTELVKPVAEMVDELRRVGTEAGEDILLYLAG